MLDNEPFDAAFTEGFYESAKEQSALNDKSGLRFIKDMSDKYPELENVSGFVDFNRPSDIVRSDECKAWVLAMRKEKI
jgi:hypothetical protein